MITAIKGNPSSLCILKIQINFHLLYNEELIWSDLGETALIVQDNSKTL